MTPVRHSTARLRRIAARFRRAEDGTATMEFAIVFPFFVFVLLSAVEMGMITYRHSMLERGLDMVVREIRLGTGTAPQHDEIKDKICEMAGVIPDCTNQLKLEMVQVDLRTSVSVPQDVDCVDHSEDAKPVRSFVNGQENEMMILRACVKFDPVFPTSGLGKYLDKDGAGQAALVASSAFVQEPE